jgi:type II secretory pathway component PulF
MKKAAFLQKLGHLLSGGFPFVRSVKLLDAETTDARLKEVTKRLLNAMSAAEPKEEDVSPKMGKVCSDCGAAIREEDARARAQFDAANAWDPGYFTETEKAMLTVGEAIGRLDRACLLVVEWLDRELSYQANR